MPSGLLNGKGCYDSVIRGEDESNLYLSIRHHNTAFLIEQRKARALEKREAKSQQEVIDREIKEWFEVGALPFARTCIKFLFMVLVWPFHFSFYQLPRLVITKVISPLVSKVKKIVEMILRPFINGFLRVYRPIAALCRKINNIYRSCINFLKSHFLALRTLILKANLQAHTYVISPPQQLLKKMRSKLLKVYKRCIYIYRAFHVCSKLLVKYGLDHIRKPTEK